MTRRKPAGMSWESWVDIQVREATERGEFDDLPGKGQPIPDIDRPRDDLWWIKAKLRREGVSMALPPALQIRKDLEVARARIAQTEDESSVRAIVVELNVRIAHVNRTTTSGPPTSLMPLDVDEEVARWRAERSASDADAT